jgi:hypothetical protein
MPRTPTNFPDQQPVLDELAKAFSLDTGDVVALYEEVVAALAAKARIDTYLHVFAMRELQDKLKARR